MSVGYAQKLDLQDYGADSAKFDKILIAGNGESRKNFDFNKITIPVIGCNALHRDFIPDHLICCDRRMVQEAMSNPLTKSSQIYVRNNWFHYFRKIKKNKNVNQLPDVPFEKKYKADDPFHWGSGPYSILLACQLNFKNLYIIGFDLYPQGHNVNNIYKDTKNYSKSSDRPVDPNYWIYQISKIINQYKNINFNFYNLDNWKMPDDWNKKNVFYKNINHIDIDIK